MIELEISKYLRANVPLVNDRVYQNLSKDNVPDPQLIFSVNPITQDFAHNDTLVFSRDILVIDVFAKEQDYATAIDITKEIDSAIKSMNKSALSGYFITATCPMARWQLIRTPKTEEIIFQRSYRLRHNSDD